MQRERRWCLRKPASLTVELHSGQEKAINCTARDISLEGLFLETSIRPDIASAVKITITSSAQQSTQAIQLNAKVVHTATDGFGIVFHDLSIDTVKTMRLLFYGKHN